MVSRRSAATSSSRPSPAHRISHYSSGQASEFDQRAAWCYVRRKSSFLLPLAPFGFSGIRKRFSPHDVNFGTFRIIIMARVVL